MEISQLLGQTLVSVTKDPANGYRMILRFASGDAISIDLTTTFDGNGDFVDGNCNFID